MLSDVTGKVGFFDRFATRASQFASRAWFFAGCVLVVLLWAPTLLGDVMSGVDAMAGDLRAPRPPDLQRVAVELLHVVAGRRSIGDASPV